MSATPPMTTAAMANALLLRSPATLNTGARNSPESPESALSANAKSPAE